MAKYQGGVATDCQEMSKSIFSLMNHTFERQKKESVQMAGPIRHYGKDIKTKRLVGHLIREIHDFSEVSLFDENLAEKE